MVWSEKLIELGNSWYSAKTILVEHSFNLDIMFGSTALNMRGIASDWGTYSSINYI